MFWGWGWLLSNEYLRNSASDTKNFFDGAQIPPFARNQFGAAESGLLARQGCAFFFANYEGLRQSLGVTRLDIVPSVAARNGQLSTGTVAVDPQAARYLTFFPLPNRGTTGDGDTGNYAFSGQQVTPENYLTARVDIHLHHADWLGLRYETISVPTETGNKLSALRKLTEATPHLGSPYFKNSTRYNGYQEYLLGWETRSTQVSRNRARA